MPAMRLYIALLTTVILLYVPSAYAEIYRWVDENGMTHYSDKAPKSLPSKKSYPRKVTHRAKVAKKPVARRAAHQSRLSFPGKKKRRVVKSSQARKPVRVTKRARVNKPVKVVKRARVSKPARSVKRARANKSVRSSKRARVNKPIRVARLVRANKPRRVKKHRRVEKVAQVSALTTDLNATFYDMTVEPQEEIQEQPQRKVITNIKQTLCTDKRMLLAALQEKGFESYHNESGEYRVAWGVEGFYKEKRRYLTEDEIAKKTKGVMFEVEQYCDNPHDQKVQDQARADWIRAEYCGVSKVILEDLKHPFMRASDRDIQDQEKEMKRFCSERRSVKDRDNERYYPKSLQVNKLQQKHFLYR